MPDAPGVYIFHGAEGDLPLYIGKSVQLRSRLLAHLRNVAGLVERNGDLQQIHVVHHWQYLGTASTLDEARSLPQVAPGFDADGYKILCKPVLSGRAKIVLL